MYVHAPDKLKRKIKKNFGLRYEEILRLAESICEVEEQSVIEQAKIFHMNLTNHTIVDIKVKDTIMKVGKKKQNVLYNNNSCNQPNQEYYKLEDNHCTSNGRDHYKYNIKDNKHNVLDYHQNQNTSKVLEDNVTNSLT